MKSFYDSSSDDENNDLLTTSTVSNGLAESTDKRKIMSVYDYMYAKNHTVRSGSLDLHLQSTVSVKTTAAHLPSSKRRRRFYSDSDEDAQNTTISTTCPIKHDLLVCADENMGEPALSQSTLTIGDLLSTPDFNCREHPFNYSTSTSAPMNDSRERPHEVVNASSNDRGRVHIDDDDDVWMDNAKPVAATSTANVSSQSAKRSIETSCQVGRRQPRMPFRRELQVAENRVLQRERDLEDHRPLLHVEPLNPFIPLCLMGTPPSCLRAIPAVRGNGHVVAQSSVKGMPAAADTSSRDEITPDVASSVGSVLCTESNPRGVRKTEMQADSPAPSATNTITGEISSPSKVEIHAEVPAYAAQYLKDYQIEGVKWLWRKYISGVGCILGDDMGEWGVHPCLGLTSNPIYVCLISFYRQALARQCRQYE